MRAMTIDAPGYRGGDLRLSQSRHRPKQQSRVAPLGRLTPRCRAPMPLPSDLPIAPVAAQGA
jgi:hypothetical protein